jgi:DNA-binding transcriptional LysR family regulator
MPVTFANLDLNLLRVFDAVMQERSVLRASHRLFQSQSAVSHSLKRLREIVGDELFVRTATGMQPTARALALAAPVTEAMRSLESALGLDAFDPATSNRRFTVAASDFMTMVVFPRLLEILAVEAPNVDIAIKPSTRIDLAEQLDLGRIDVALGTFSTVPARFATRGLFAYDEVLVTGAAAGQCPLTMEALAGLSVVVVSLGGERDGAVDGYISERGLARRSEMYDQAAFEQAFAACARQPRVAVSLPHFLAIPALLHGSRMAAIVPRPLADCFAFGHRVAVHELPYPTTRFEVGALWHERLAGDRAQAWLRDALWRATEALRARLCG